MSYNSNINIKLPVMPRTQNPELQKELIIIYDALRILSSELSKANERILILENYNVTNP